MSTAEMKTRGFDGFYTIVGDDAQRAMNQLHSMLNRNPTWASLTATVFVCQRTLEVYAALKTSGILANIRWGKSVTLSFQDKISALHETTWAWPSTRASRGTRCVHEH